MLAAAKQAVDEHALTAAPQRKELPFGRVKPPDRRAPVTGLTSATGVRAAASAPVAEGRALSGRPHRRWGPSAVEDLGLGQYR
jgi:hypothetical protein